MHVKGMRPISSKRRSPRHWKKRARQIAKQAINTVRRNYHDEGPARILAWQRGWSPTAVRRFKVAKETLLGKRRALAFGDLVIEGLSEETLDQAGLGWCKQMEAKHNYELRAKPWLR